MRFFFLLSFVSVLSFSQDNDGNFDWESYNSWNNTTVYSKTYVVDNNHVNASDENEGTYDAPFKTINKAAQVVKAGERVLIFSGVYRETIFPKNGGISENKMISYEAAPGENVVIKGSDILSQNWEQRKVYTDVVADSSLTYTWSRRTWVTTLPENFFGKNYNPFKLANILPEEHALMPWAKLVKKIPPYTSSRALLFQNGKRLKQMEAYGDVVRIPGSFWIDSDARTIHVHSFDSGDPNRTLIEIGTKSHLFKPQKVGLNYIQVSGLTFEHCANGFLRTSTGAVTALGGHHWIFENNTIRQNNSSGLEFGFLAYEQNDPHPENIPRSRKDALGGVIVRNNTIYDCGTAGIRSFVVPNTVITGNHIYNCGWQDAENYWECSGIKMLVCYNTLVKGNYIHNIQGGNGIWLDWDIRYSRVTQNVIHDIQNIQGGIFIEASHYPNLVDNNFLWNIDGNGIYANDSDNLMVYHNLVANITGNVVHAIVQTDRYQNGRKLTAEENKVFNNIFIDGLPMRFSSNSNKADHNLYISTKAPNYFKHIKANGPLDSGSNIESAEAFFIPDVALFNWMADFEVKPVPLLEEVKYDFYNSVKESNTTIPGPFNRLSKKTRKLLSEY
ncbi:right-handed parallel beta-helix repeat-containing protein [Seonamhaeicola sp.]|uniref:right-handed parallel beta-helix repeat-containing protein n=1 Tax=Seonamhaeicola sp. TaxID=1912245 RepID=UPI0026386A56|nr:right-handed parallel beta-helix repeat-containing protein [Seonamhaeicola sp.]